MKNIVHANSAIEIGDLLLSEKPFAYVLSSKEQGYRCDNCLQRNNVLKCSGCQFVYYCGRSCQREAWADHKWECANLKRVAPKVVPDGARMLAKVINRLNRGDGHSFRAFYTETSFRMWKDLMSHYSDLKTDKKRIDHFTSLSVVLYQFLNDISLPNVVELLGLYGRMVINSFMILDIDMNSIGTGIYLASSIVDHSCEPNAVVTFDGKTINIRAIRNMPCLDWTQIRISYIDLMKTPHDRQTELLESYYFLCQCARCLDGIQAKYVHAAKCLNSICNHPVNIPWRDGCPIVRKPDIVEVQKEPHLEKSLNNELHSNHLGNSGQSNDINNQDDENAQIGELNDEIQNSKHDERIQVNDLHDDDSFRNVNDSSPEVATNVMSCEECGTKYTEDNVKIFTETMDFTYEHLKNMEGASVAYVDICNYCLERHEGVLHPLNVMHAQTLDHAFEALIQMQLWEKACMYAEKLIPCFRFYYSEINPLLGLLHLKYGKVLLYKMDLEKSVFHLRCAEKIIKITHGASHPLYREQLISLLQQAVMESS